ncbi:MAG: dihydroorotate dehydrogenase [Bacteroidales bacterium]
MVDLSVKIGGLEFKNPVTLASGTCGYGKELEDFINIDELGGLFVKGLTMLPREGNAYPRMAETPSGMLNAVGLQNKGLDDFVKRIYPRVSEYGTNVIVNVNGSSIDDYIKLSEAINALEGIPAMELNISCPNVKAGGMAFGVDPKMARAVVKEVRRVYDKTLIVKLSPNVTDIVAMARIAEEEGANAVSLINTLLGMAIDAQKRKPILSTITGGLSGAAVKPIALRMVWQVASAVKIPVVGVGGIMTATDVVEFLLAGASVVQIGTGVFLDPSSPTKIIANLKKYCVDNGIDDVKKLIGALDTSK